MKRHNANQHKRSTIRNRNTFPILRVKGDGTDFLLSRGILSGPISFFSQPGSLAFISWDLLSKGHRSLETHGQGTGALPHTRQTKRESLRWQGRKGMRGYRSSEGHCGSGGHEESTKANSEE